MWRCFANEIEDVVAGKWPADFAESVSLCPVVVAVVQQGLRGLDSENLPHACEHALAHCSRSHHEP